MRTIHHAVRSRATGERGTALVETALIIPLFFTLLLGMISGGILYNRQMQLTHAAREGARYGVTVPSDQVFSNGQSWIENVRDVVVERAAGELTAAQVCVSLVEGDTAVVVDGHTTNTDGSPCFDDGAGGEAATRVQVEVARDAVLDALFVKYPVTLKAKASGKHEQG